MALVVVAVCAAARGWAQTQNPTARAVGATADKTSAPTIEFAKPVFDAGSLTAGAVVRHEYGFTNLGTAPLMVTAVEPSCGCTTIEKWTTRVEAGQTGTVPIYFDSTGLNGEISRWIVVVSNDPVQPKAMLTLKAMVRDPIERSPGSAIFTPAAGALASETKLIRIINRTAEPLDLSAPTVGNRAFAAELKTIVPGREFELRVTTVPPFVPGTVRAAITINTNLSQVPVLTVEAVVVVQPARS